MTLKHFKVGNAGNQKVIENIDILWLKRNKIEALFEIESTTSMTSALMRGSNVDKAVNKFMVIPEERDAQFGNKMTSPLFKDHFENENWNIIYFDALRAAYVKDKSNLDIYSIIDKKGVAVANVDKNEQERLF